MLHVYSHPILLVFRVDAIPYLYFGNCHWTGCWSTEKGFLSQICLISEPSLHATCPSGETKFFLFSWSLSLTNFETGSCKMPSPLPSARELDWRRCVLLCAFRSHTAAPPGLLWRPVSESQARLTFRASCTHYEKLSELLQVKLFWFLSFSKDRQLSKGSKGTEAKAGESSLQLSRCEDTWDVYSVLTWLLHQLVANRWHLRLAAGGGIPSPCCRGRWPGTSTAHTCLGPWCMAHWTSWVSQCQKGMRYKIKGS